MRNMSDDNEFHTARGYEIIEKQLNGITSSMEDYLEMIYRLDKSGSVRAIELAKALNVRPSSVTKMIQRLSSLDLVKYEKYGDIRLTEKGSEFGKYLYDKHCTIANFLKFIGVYENLLKDVERIEHNVSRETLKCIIHFMDFVRDNSEWIQKGWKTWIDKHNR